MGSWLQHMKSLIFSCGIWGLIPWPRIKLGPPALGVWSLSHWTTREVPRPGTSWRHGNCFIHLCLTLCITHSVLKNIFLQHLPDPPAVTPSDWLAVTLRLGCLAHPFLFPLEQKEIMAGAVILAFCPTTPCIHLTWWPSRISQTLCLFST